MIGLRTGDGHEIFVTSQVGSLSGSGSRSRSRSWSVRSRPPGCPTGTDRRELDRGGSTSAAAQERNRRC